MPGSSEWRKLRALADESEARVMAASGGTLEPLPGEAAGVLFEKRGRAYLLAERAFGAGRYARARELARLHQRLARLEETEGGSGDALAWFEGRAAAGPAELVEAPPGESVPLRAFPGQAFDWALTRQRRHEEAWGSRIADAVAAARAQLSREHPEQERALLAAVRIDGVLASWHFWLGEWPTAARHAASVVAAIEAPGSASTPFSWGSQRSSRSAHLEYQRAIAALALPGDEGAARFLAATRRGRVAAWRDGAWSRRQLGLMHAIAMSRATPQDPALTELREDFPALAFFLGDERSWS